MRVDASLPVHCIVDCCVVDRDQGRRSRRASDPTRPAGRGGIAADAVRPVAGIVADVAKPAADRTRPAGLVAPLASLPRLAPTTTSPRCAPLTFAGAAFFFHRASSDEST